MTMTKTEALFIMCCHVQGFLDVIGDFEVTPEMRKTRKKLRAAYMKLWPVATAKMEALQERRADKHRVWSQALPDRIGRWRVRGMNLSASTVDITAVPEVAGPLTIDRPDGSSLTVVNPEWSYLGPLKP